MGTYPDPACPRLQEQINPNDVIFVVGDEQQIHPCPNDDPTVKSGSRFPKMNLLKYRIYHGESLTKTPSLPNTSCSLHCSRFKVIKQKY